MYIKSLNFGYLSFLSKNNIKYHNAFCSFIDENTVLCKGRGGEFHVQADKFLLSGGGRPTYLGLPGEK